MSIRNAVSFALSMACIMSPTISAAENVSGQVLKLGHEGRVTLNLTSAHLKGGESAQLVRQTTQGSWVLAAEGRILSVDPSGSVLEIQRYEPGMAGVVIGDYVVVTLNPAVQAYPGSMGQTGAAAKQGDASTPGGAPAQAAAQSLEAEAILGEGFPLSISLGAKGLFGFSGKEAPAEAPVNESGKAGTGWMAGASLELRLSPYLGFETGIYHFSNTLKKTTTIYNDATQAQDHDVQQAITSSAWRVPLLLKAVLPVKGESVDLRFWLGGGLGLSFGKNSSLDVNVVPARQVDEAQISAVEAEYARRYQTAAIDQNLWLISLGMAVVVEDVAVSLEARVAYNPDTFPGYEDYLADRGGTEFSEHTIDAGLMLGFAYDINLFL